MIHVALFDQLTDDPQGQLDGVTRFLGIDDLPLAPEDRTARLPAARAPSVLLASAVRPSADWVREHDGARLVGHVNRSSLVQRALYRPIGRQAVRPEPGDVMTVPKRWPVRSPASSVPSGSSSASPGAGRRAVPSPCDRHHRRAERSVRTV